MTPPLRPLVVKTVQVRPLLLLVLLIAARRQRLVEVMVDSGPAQHPLVVTADLLGSWGGGRFWGDG